MSIFTSIATTVLAKGASKLLGGGKKKQKPALPKMKATKTRYSKNLRSSPVEMVLGSTTSQVDRVIDRHRSIMNSLNVEKGAVAGKYGSLRI